MSYPDGPLSLAGSARRLLLRLPLVNLPSQQPHRLLQRPNAVLHSVHDIDCFDDRVQRNKVGAWDSKVHRSIVQRHSLEGS